ncbi:unnamed protein product [Eruca vesicaria subsp. sativa]|uniref:Uncharacterized protein n=1 Tax=Eruca vesicaria subsp. sativa TaxID=29727 RepID=A0ABC8JTD7_ERUVS|nr:unnamed protein product [Eruca vesicaria subsp. sativa]
MNRHVLSIVALILLLFSAFDNAAVARTLTLPREGISTSIKVGVSRSVSPPARKKGPGAPGQQNP